MQRSFSQRASRAQCLQGHLLLAPRDTIRDTVPTDEQTTQPTRSLVPHPHPQSRGTPGPTRKKTEDNTSGTEGTPHTLGGDSPQVPPPAPDKNPCKRLPSPPGHPSPARRLTTCSSARAPAQSWGWAAGRGAPARGVGEREPPPGPSRSSLHSARASSLTLPR